jgi:hypothetical protein
VATDKYIDWGANEDGRGVVRREGNAAILADTPGPRARRSR